MSFSTFWRVGGFHPELLQPCTFIIYIRNQEAMVLPETVPGTIYTTRDGFLHPGVGPTSIQFSAGRVQQFPVVSRGLRFLNNVAGEFGKKAVIGIGIEKTVVGEDVAGEGIYRLSGS